MSRILIDNAHRMTDFFRTVIEDALSDMGNAGVVEAKLRKLELEMEQLKKSHAHEMAEFKHNSGKISSALLYFSVNP